jgi:putative DNA primase/helicase
VDKSEDEIRVPYGRSTNIWPRQTVFTGTVNDTEFLVDATGNARWWVIKTLSFVWDHKVNMQQVWAEVKALYDAGETWYLSPDESREQAIINRGHEVTDPIEENIYKYFLFNTLPATWCNMLRTTDVLDVLGMQHVNRGHTTKTGSILRKLVGSPVQLRINGVPGRYYKMPEKRTVFDDVPTKANKLTVLKTGAKK